MIFLSNPQEAQGKANQHERFFQFLEGLFPPGDWIPESFSVDIDEIFQAINHNKLWDHLNYCNCQEVHG